MDNIGTNKTEDSIQENPSYEIKQEKKNKKNDKKQDKKPVKFSLYFITIGSIIIILILFALIVMNIGYYAFTKSFEKEYSENARHVTELSNYVVEGYDVTCFLEYTEDELDHICNDFVNYADYEAECLAKGEEPSEEAYMDALYFCTLKEGLTTVCNTMGMSVIYIIKPDPDYKHYTCIFNCVNSDSEYDPWPLGKVVETPSEYYEAYENILEKGSNSEVVSRYNNLGSGKPHITALAPIKDEDGNVVAILCVQRFADGLTSTRKNFIQGVGAIGIIVIIFIILLEIKLLRGSVIKPIDRISREAGRFASESTKAEVGLSEKNYRVREIHDLTVALDKMEEDTVNNIENITQMAVEKERIGADLDLASKIQIGMLPLKHQLLKDHTEFDIHATMTPAKEVGGDFYDFYMIDDTHLVILVADVSDKGVGAAFFMSISKTLLKSRAGMGGKATEIIEYVDRMIAEKNVAGMFVTVWFAIIDLETGHVDVCNAGHDYPALMLNGQDYVIEKTPHGPPIGFIPGATFIGYEFNMVPGDRIFLYTDGLNEAKRSDGERFGLERMLTVLNNHKNASNEELIATMKDSVSLFVGSEPQFDDMTMLSFTFNKKI
ncbi:Stage II sporulation protein E (SpoIIE) [Lachnospiraceae bacterium NE2001]|nr:Stage II sporulation protein E (SpoIIE) [Lachnospiraceae bacterium NE2001]